MKIPDDEKLRIPSASLMERLTELLRDDEDFRFPTLKLNRNKKPRFELPEHNKEDRDNIETSPSFKAVIVVARKNFYQSDEDKEKGRDAKEKRVLYVLRPGKVTPERIFISPTALRNWKGFCAACSKNGQRFYEVICEFSAEHVDPAKSEFAWNRAKFAIDRPLTTEEQEHVMAVRTLVDERVKVYEDDSDLDKAEAEQLGLPRGDDDDDGAEKHSKKRRRDLEDDDDDEPKKGKKPGAKAGKKSDDDDDDAPAKKTGKKSDDDDDDPPVKKGKAGYPNLDEDDDAEDLKSAKGGKKSDDDDDDAPAKGGKKSPSLDDDDDD